MCMAEAWCRTAYCIDGFKSAATAPGLRVCPGDVVVRREGYAQFFPRLGMPQGLTTSIWRGQTRPGEAGRML